MSLEAFERGLSDAALWLISALEPWLASSGLRDEFVLSDQWVEFLVDIKQSVLWPFLVFGVAWFALRVTLALCWGPLRLGRRGAWWKSLSYIWALVIVVTLTAVAVDVRRNALRAELAFVNSSLEAGVDELEGRVKRMQLRCLWSGAVNSAPNGSRLGPIGLPTEQHCENANGLRHALRQMRTATNADSRNSGLQIADPNGRTTWREFAREVDRLLLHFPDNPRLSFLTALDDRVQRRDDFGPGRTRWTAFGWLDRDQATINTARTELGRLTAVALLLSGWPYLFAFGLALRLLKTAAESRIETERRGMGALPTRVVEHFVTARGGRFTYRVLAPAPLSDGELQGAIQNALEEGRVKEPEPGETATLVV
jgi:hypothetical protein